MGRASEATPVPSPIGAAAQGATEGGVSACDGLRGGEHDHGEAVKRLRWDLPMVVPEEPATFSHREKKKKEREANKQIWISPPSIPKYNEIRRAVWEGDSLKGGRGSLTAGETDGARFSQSPPHASFLGPRRLEPAPGAGDARLEETILLPLELGLRGWGPS